MDHKQGKPPPKRKPPQAPLRATLSFGRGAGGEAWALGRQYKEDHFFTQEEFGNGLSYWLVLKCLLISKKVIAF